jgi:peroxiredoxin
MGARRHGKSWLALLAGLALVQGCGGDLVVLKPMDPAPPFALEDLEGKSTSLEELEGKYVMLRFWADWCKSCRWEMPLVEEKYRQYHEAGLEVLALNVRQDRDTAARFARDVGVTYPVLLDRDGSTAEAYGVIGLPTSFLLDREGRVMEEVIGDMTRRSLSELLDPLFEGAEGGGGVSIPDAGEAP